MTPRASLLPRRKPGSWSALLNTLAVLAVLAAWAALGTHPAQAHGGHDHGGAASAAVPTAAPRDSRVPQRLADGSLFVPKPVQRQLGVRTVLTEAGEHAAVHELMGRVVADPAAGGAVQPLQAGRLEAGPLGWPVPGQRVQRGQVLARLQPALGAQDLAAQQAQVAELRAGLPLARQRLDRLQQLEGSVPAKEIQAARAEVAALDGRLRALQAGLAAVELLRAPVTGVVSRVAARAGEVVEPRQTLFEVVDPARLRVEARLADVAQARAIGADATAVILAPGSAAPSTAGGSAAAPVTPASTPSAPSAAAIPLRRIGAGLALEEGTLPLWFAVASTAADAPPLAVGQPVTVLARGASRQRGVAVPASAVVKSAANLDQVFIHPSAERFTPVAVSVQPLDGRRVLVTAGLAAGQRVVVQGAALLNQVR
ncbi:MAG: HlyD family efflux transporter periplasmic adaptor subunit [Burkholderiales bacterium]|nr:HlyD family efflux transporter periplasmic adaptor subunit [Burkholderiales bacterium]